MCRVKRAFKAYKVFRGFQIRIGLPYSWAIWLAKRIFLGSKQKRLSRMAQE